ncbi:serine/threonine protein kinase [Saccharothrix variisporea]|uniref:non-specific serine/threonine protein kinase n=1 Tax=Saccharothrix variisporea TaxID=543527 RepID=A0A495XHL6_9PSEU|nr:protein kinase [Saccharothrix variisporea]RKT72666.1 serine/threonine protein kinase [Saccharothrix variisporea]
METVIAPRLLASGPVASVYAATLADTGAEVAVKVYAERFDRDTTEWLDRERRALASAAVPQVLPVDGIVELPDGRSGVRMRLCHGSLADLLSSAVGSPGVRDALGVGLAIARALAAAHSVGVVHGGITPHNVLWHGSGEFVVSDFGLSLRERFPRDPTHALEFTAPETLRDDSRTTASDLYGLGAVLHTMLTGAPPFPRRTGEPPSERILRVLREQVPPVRGEGVPHELADAVNRLLAKDPAARPPDAGELARLFEDLLTTPHHPTFAGPPPVPSFVDAPRPPGRTLVHTTDNTAAPKRTARAWRTPALIGAGLVVASLVAVPLLLPDDEPAKIPVAATTTPKPTTSTEPAQVTLVLDPPADQGDHVELTWQADRELDFTVVVAGEGIQNMFLVAHRQHSLRVPVDPGRRYCFQVRGTDSRAVYTSEPVPVRGARCTL